MEKEGKCPFAEGCSFFHNDVEKRNLIDPLPNLPEGVTLPPMPEKRYSGHKGRYNQNHSGNKSYYNDSGSNNSSPSISPFQFSPLNPQPPSLIQITSFAEMAAFGGFNPNKYLSPAPIAMQTQIQNLGFNGNQPQMFVAQNPQWQGQQWNNQQNNGNAPGPQGNQNQGNYKGYNNQKNFKPRSPKKNAQHRYEKKEG